MPVLPIPELTPLKSFEKLRPSSPQPPNAPPVPDYLYYFDVPGVAREDVAEVLVAVVMRRIVERARKAARGKSSLTRPSAWRVIGAGVFGALLGGITQTIVTSATGHALTADPAPIVPGIGVGLILGLLYGWWRRAPILSAYNGLELVSATPDQLLHKNYWLPFAIVKLCSPKPTMSLEA